MARNQGWNALGAVTGVAMMGLGAWNTFDQYEAVETVRGREDSKKVHVAHWVGDQPGMFWNMLFPGEIQQIPEATDTRPETVPGPTDLEYVNSRISIGLENTRDGEILALAGAFVLVGSVKSLKR